MTKIGSRVRRLEDRLRPEIGTLRGRIAMEAEAARSLVAEHLARWGIERGQNESLAETLARALGLGPMELRQELARRAAGALR